MIHLRHCNTEIRRMQQSYHLSYGLWSLLDLVFRSNIEKLLRTGRTGILKGLLSTPVRLSEQSTDKPFISKSTQNIRIDPIWPIFIQMLHTFVQKSGKYRKMLLVSFILDSLSKWYFDNAVEISHILEKPYFNHLKWNSSFNFSLWKINTAMKIYKKFRLIVSYMTMILVCGNYWTILSSLGIWKCGIWNLNRPRSQIVRREARNGIRRRNGQNSKTDINKEMSSVRYDLLPVYFRCTSGLLPVIIS